MLILQQTENIREGEIMRSIFVIITFSRIICSQEKRTTLDQTDVTVQMKTKESKSGPSTHLIDTTSSPLMPLSSQTDNDESVYLNVTKDSNKMNHSLSPHVHDDKCDYLHQDKCGDICDFSYHMPNCYCGSETLPSPPMGVPDTSSR